MFFKQFLRDDLGCASYMVGDTDVGECVVVDPQWDVTSYVQTAGERGLRITHIIETHNHADHVSGHGKLAQLGAQVAIHRDAGVDYEHLPLDDGSMIQVGSVRIEALHTPGHRPEHIALAVTDTTRADEPWMVLTGDALFVGDVGRPDLAVEPQQGASDLFRSLRDKLLPLYDGVEIYPAHVAGSLCGKAMSAKGSSTVGFERRFNAALGLDDKRQFVSQVTKELPPQPPQFGRIVALNRGPFLTADLVIKPLSIEEFEDYRDNGALILDTRSPEAFGGGHVPGALNVDLHGGQFGTRASWIISEGKPFVLILATNDDLAVASSSLAAVGQFGVVGYLAGGMDAWDTSGRPLESIRQVGVQELGEMVAGGRNGYTILDVREESEWREGHIESALNIPFHQLQSHLDDLPSSRPVATICGSGTRSSIAASLLQREGFEVANVAGGMDAWLAAGNKPD
jgi:glyoxylase-like metal-dependent hydrolase (beta-lactamase superfamily II)/rhodanese-related sulfurtransferase